METFSQDERKRVNTKKRMALIELPTSESSNRQMVIPKCTLIKISAFPEFSYIGRRQSCENCELRMRKLYHFEHGKYQTFSYRFTVE
ncbi:hypothetical protein EAG_15582 [Camponotus floridanus]|uniref:Uncharacterized protein n=1 Tax=Camponotus floridanus TaxID=104421 RepID=E2AIZ5_CAMFO|nr:hypothetical protein EAG_15582 [Camponotus floridanus]